MRNTKGFTLAELLITMAIIGILASVAIPAYKDSVRKTKRAEGKSLLLEGAQFLEQHFTEHNQYPTAIDGNNPPDGIFLETVSDNGNYVMTISNNTATTFTLTATPQGSHIDTICGSLSLDHLGVKSESGSTDVLSDCW